MHLNPSLSFQTRHGGIDALHKSQCCLNVSIWQPGSAGFLWETLWCGVTPPWHHKPTYNIHIKNILFFVYWLMISDLFCDISALFWNISNLFCEISVLFCEISVLFVKYLKYLRTCCWTTTLYLLFLQEQIKGIIINIFSILWNIKNMFLSSSPIRCA